MPATDSARNERMGAYSCMKYALCLDIMLSMMMMMMSWCLMSSDVIWHIRDKLWPMPKHGSIKSTYIRCMRVLAVTCHLHFWQNDRDFLRATVVTRGWNGYRNKSQHRKSTLEKKILPPFQQGFEPATFQSRVRRSNHWAIPAPQCYLCSLKLFMYSPAVMRRLKTWHQLSSPWFNGNSHANHKSKVNSFVAAKTVSVVRNWSPA